MRSRRGQFLLRRLVENCLISHTVNFSAAPKGSNLCIAYTYTYHSLSVWYIFMLFTWGQRRRYACIICFFPKGAVRSCSSKLQLQSVHYVGRNPGEMFMGIGKYFSTGCGARHIETDCPIVRVISHEVAIGMHLTRPWKKSTTNVFHNHLAYEQT